MLWLQRKMANHELSIKQVPTTYSIADLNAKGLGRDRFLSLLFMIGFVNSKGEPVGEAEFLRLQAKERIKAHVKVIGSCLKDTTSMTSHGVSSANMNETAKRVLRILSTCSLLELAVGYEVDGMSPSPEALGLWSYVFRAMILAICLAVGFGFLAGRISFGRRYSVRDAGVQEPQEVPFQDEADGGDLHFQVKMYKTHQLRTTFCRSDVEKLHAAVARSGLGPFFEVQMLKNCTPLWREAHFQVKM